MISLGEAERQAGRPEYRTTLLKAARMAEAIGDAERMGRAALANSRGFASTFGRVDHERVAVLARAIELERSRNPSRRAQLLSLQAMELQFDPDFRRRRALADDALALARESGDLRSLPYVMRNHFHATWAADTLASRHRIAEEMTELAADSGDPLARFWAIDRRIHVAMESGAVEHAAEDLAALREQADKLAQPGLRWPATYYAAGISHLRGDLPEAELRAEAARRLGEQAAEPDMIFIYSAQIATIRVEQGREDEVVDLLKVAAAEYPAVPSYEAALAAVLCDLDRTSEAASLLAPHVDRRFTTIPQDQIYTTALALWSKVAADTGCERAAEQLSALIEPWQDQFVWGGAVGWGSAHTFLGMLASTMRAFDRASDHHAAASHLHLREAVRPWEARNLHYLAKAQLAAGAPLEALTTAERALAIARSHNLDGAVTRAEALIHLISSREHAVSAEPL